MIYLDYAATTPIDEQVFDSYFKLLKNYFANSASIHKMGLRANEFLNAARESIAGLIEVEKEEVIFTSGATESNNLAIMGSKRNGKWEYVFSEGEHPSVYNVAKELENNGFTVHFVKLQKNGQVDYGGLEKVLNEKTRFVSVMHVSNETGAVNDIKRISNLRNKFAPKALLHVDGVQAFCKLNFSLEGLGVDFYTISAHKFHGPKGVGALYVRDFNCLKPVVFGGGQENGYRSGTENVAGIMAMAYAIDNINIAQNYDHVLKLYKQMQSVLDRDEKVHVHVYDGSPYILNAWFEGVNAETLVRALHDQGVLIGKGSACSSKKSGNRILESIGFDKDQIKSHARISFSDFNTLQEVRKAGEIILSVYNQIREKVQ